MCLLNCKLTPSSLPTSIATPSAKNAATISGSHVAAANVADPNGAGWPNAARRAPFGAANDTVRSVPYVAANADDARPVNNHIKVEVCKYYRRGTCRHGQSGKTLWNGGACNFRHPRKCMRFCKFGDHPVQGCTKRVCPLLHPVICSSSYNNGMCSNINCSFQHLFGTVRTYESTQTNYQIPHSTKYGHYMWKIKNDTSILTVILIVVIQEIIDMGYLNNSKLSILWLMIFHHFLPHKVKILPKLHRRSC